MHRSFTLNDLILFAFSETDDNEARNYHDLIRGNKLLAKEYNTICKVKQYFAKSKVGPSKSVINNILNYSRALSVNSTKEAGNFSLLLN
jgi:hypothetical protein